MSARFHASAWELIAASIAFRSAEWSSPFWAEPEAIATREATHTKIGYKKARDAASFLIGTAFPSVNVYFSTLKTQAPNWAQIQNSNRRSARLIVAFDGQLAES
jgi:hypothetical protein